MRVVHSYRRMDRAVTGAASRMRRMRQEAVERGPILAAVADHTGVSASEICGGSRTREATYARHLAMWALTEHGLLGPTLIGRILGNRDHGTVISGIRRIAAEMTSRPETARDVQAIADLVRGRKAATA